MNVPRGSLCLFFPFYLEPLTTCSLHPQCFLSSQSSTVLTTDAALTERALSYRWILPTSRQSGVVSPCASVLIAWLRLSPLPGLARISRGTVNPPGELLPGPLSHLSIAPPSSSKASLPPITSHGSGLFCCHWSLRMKCKGFHDHPYIKPLPLNS